MLTAPIEHIAAALLLPAIGILLALSSLILALLVGRSRARSAALWLAVAASVGIVALGVVAITGGQEIRASLGSVLGFAVIDLRYDALAAPFLLALGVVGAAASIYGLGYSAHDETSRGRIFAAYPVFLASLLLVFGAADAFAFLLAWELMALSSVALVFGATPGRAIARAGYLYLAMTHVATAALIVAFAILGAEAGSTSFGAFGAAAPRLPAPVRDVVFVLLLVAPHVRSHARAAAGGGGRSLRHQRGRARRHLRRAGWRR